MITVYIIKYNDLCQYNNRPLVPESKISKYFTNLTDTVIPLPVQEVLAIGPKFCNVTEATNKNIVSTIKNVECALKSSDAPLEEKQTIRH